MKIINVDAFQYALPVERFDGWIIRYLISPDYYEQLCQSYPKTDYHTIDSRSEQVSIQESEEYLGGYMDVRVLDRTNPGSGLISLSPVWQKLLDDVLSDTYDKHLSKATGVSLKFTGKVIRFIRYHNDGFLDAHFDNQAGKVLTQIFYPNLFWYPSWGGYLELLSEPDGDRRTVLLSVPPLVSYSVINRSTTRAYHQVSKVTNTAPSRQAFLIEWYACEK